ncbi:hypothetical protein SUDANB95_04790 [Actinosynnema sp. ALI-1.44]
MPFMTTVLAMAGVVLMALMTAVVAFVAVVRCVVVRVLHGSPLIHTPWG